MRSSFTHDDIALLEAPSGWAGMRADSWFSPNPNPARELCAVSVRRTDARGMGIGVWNVDTGRVEQFWMGSRHMLWLAGGNEALVGSYLGGGGNRLSRWRVSGWREIGNLAIPSGRGGCTIHQLMLSPSERWLSTMRTSGQGEWGYDLIGLDRMRREGGIPSERGYMFTPPAFAGDESRMVGGYGESWLGGWWAHPDDDREEPARGGVITFGRIVVHGLPGNEVTWHELRMTVPKGWLPSNVDDEKWMGPSDITPFGEGIRMTLPGGLAYEHPDALPPVIDLPMPAAD